MFSLFQSPNRFATEWNTHIRRHTYYIVKESEYLYIIQTTQKPDKMSVM